MLTSMVLLCLLPCLVCKSLLEAWSLMLSLHYVWKSMPSGRCAALISLAWDIATRRGCVRSVGQGRAPKRRQLLTCLNLLLFVDFHPIVRMCHLTPSLVALQSCRAPSMKLRQPMLADNGSRKHEISSPLGAQWLWFTTSKIILNFDAPASSFWLSAKRRQCCIALLNKELAIPFSGLAMIVLAELWATQLSLSLDCPFGATRGSLSTKGESLR